MSGSSTEEGASLLAAVEAEAEALEEDLWRTVVKAE